MPGWDVLRQRIASIAETHAKLADPVAHELSIEIPREFATASDPYGNSWPALSATTVRRKGHAQILYEHGPMLLDTRAISDGHTIRFEGPEYGLFHQRAHGNRPARPVIPNGPELPAGWQTVISSEFGKAVSAALKR